MKLDTAFSHIPMSEWPGKQSSLSIMEVVRHLCVANDYAKRGVKLCHDFLRTKVSTHESRLQNVLQVVENNRNVVPNQRKRKIESKAWFIKL